MRTALKYTLGIILLSFLADIFSLCSAESCTVDTDCSTTTCSGGSSLICQHPDGVGIQDNNGVCTCGTTVQCTQQSDCFDLTNLPCPEAQRHCYDNKCICDRFPIG